MADTAAELTIDPAWDAQGYPEWSDNLEALLHKHVEPNGWFPALIKYDGELRTALIHGRVWPTQNRKWTVRAIVVVGESDDSALATVCIQYPGEDPNLPGGGRKMYPRRPIDERLTTRLQDVRTINGYIGERVAIIDAAAEEVHHSVVASMKNDSIVKRLLRKWL